MKGFKFLLTIIIYLLSIPLYAQTQKDITVINYIKAQKEFVGVTDVNKIPNSIKPYFSSIESYMEQRKWPFGDYWISTSSIRESPNSISVSIYHYNGFVVEKELEERQKKLDMARVGGDTIVVIRAGTPNGGGILVIDKDEKRVVSYQRYQ
jgi:hypothetical protein